MKNKFSFLIAVAATLLATAFLFSLHQKQEVKIAELETKVASLDSALQASSASIQMLQLQQKKNRATVQMPRFAPAAGSSKDQLFQFLYLINGNASSENASVPKKIRYLPNQLWVQDFETLKDDRFFELLAFLLDQDLVKGVEIPKKAEFSKPKKELIAFGLSPDLISTSKEGEFRIFLNDFKH